MKTSRTWRHLGACVVLVGLLATGCSDDGSVEDPTPPTPTGASEEPSATEAPSPTPGPTPWPEPTRPAAMERDDVEGAKAAAEYFLALYPYVYVTGDLDAWREISHPECQFCESVVGNVEELHSSGGYADGPVIAIMDIDATPPDDEYEFFAVSVDAREQASSEYSASGAVVAETPSSSLAIDLALSVSDGRWVIRGAVGTETATEAPQ